jgi:NAD(P)-dependent dehydrogenase (short-subunit alcohol dehydrogenase family)
MHPHAWSYNIEVNLNGPFFLIRAALPELRRRGGRVVNVSSGAAEKAIPGWSAYCAAKAALTHFTRILAAEEPEIVAVSLRPGVVDTAMQEAIREKGAAGMDADKLAYFRELKAGGKLEPPDVPGRAMAWLALRAPREWSGEFLDYDDPRIAGPAADFFGRSGD